MGEDAFLMLGAEGGEGQAVAFDAGVDAREDRAGVVAGGPAPLGGGACGALVSLAHVEHSGGPDGDDFGVAIATHDRGNDLDALLAFADHAAGVQPGMEAAHVGGVRALGEDAFLILGRIGAVGV